ncbi:hypothetical protein BOS5A_110532 [Bosea sp. EC-HK365B]|nr:hypothetical protein BOSE21B_110177 [Bosea sp. 21B]CAD5282728.1 hypothetical protein BOSE7B_41037 [Bosea sp. 7B]VVT52034.1 hypothetical protein BOS5A_110532 [Bosea sp. EC-HK365B]
MMSTWLMIARPVLGRISARLLNKAELGREEGHGLDFTSRNEAWAPSRFLSFD